MNDTSPAVEPVLVDAVAAAGMLSVSTRHLWSMTAPRGPIPCVKIGCRILFRPESLRRWAAEAESAGGGE